MNVTTVGLPAKARCSARCGSGDVTAFLVNLQALLSARRVCIALEGFCCRADWPVAIKTPSAHRQCPPAGRNCQRVMTCQDFKSGMRFAGFVSSPYCTPSH